MSSTALSLTTDRFPGRFALSAIAALTLFLGGLASTPEPAAASHSNLATYCSPSGDFCTQIFRNTSTGQIKLRLSTFVHHGRYSLCVKPDGGSVDCDIYRLRQGANGLKNSTIDWASNYSTGSAKRSVTWRKAGNQIGPTLSFNPNS